jgi:signal transduction histidine kinase
MKIKEKIKPLLTKFKDMISSSRIKKKLIVANILMIIISFGLAAGLLAVFFNGPGMSYWEIIENVVDDNNSVYSAQALMRTCTDRKHLPETKREMAKAGYHFRTERNGSIMYSSLTKSDLTAADDLAGTISRTQHNYTITRGKTVVIRKTFRDDGSTYQVTAVRTPETAATADLTSGSYMKRYIEYFIGFLIVILLLAVIGLNLLLSRWISRSILKPLKDLSDGSDRIRRGDLDFEMSTDRKDEIGTVMNDFDEMRRHLQESVAERLRYEQDRREMIIGISHDLRTPLTSIRGYIEGLRDGIADTPEKREKYYRAIEVSTAGLEQIVSDLTDLSKLESGRNHFHLELVELNTWYNACVKDLQAGYLKDNVDIELRESEEPLYADLDIGEMQRIHTNLLDNTVKYRDKDSSKVTITLSSEDDDAVIRIADDGPGVKKKDLDRVFTCFYRGDEARTDPRRGCGIGLSVVKQIVEGFGGTVTAESDDGFAVIIRLPLKENQNEKSTDY